MALASVIVVLVPLVIFVIGSQYLARAAVRPLERAEQTASDFITAAAAGDIPAMRSLLSPDGAASITDTKLEETSRAVREELGPAFRRERTDEEVVNCADLRGEASRARCTDQKQIRVFVQYALHSSAQGSARVVNIKFTIRTEGREMRIDAVDAYLSPGSSLDAVPDTG